VLLRDSLRYAHARLIPRLDQLEERAPR
jgi:hypothetical protein